MIKSDFVSHFRRFTDNNARAMIDKKTPAYLGAGMDIDMG